MACCCCQGSGICCQGATCSSVNACACQQQGGTFQQGRTCQEVKVCGCSGQQAYEIGICETCPQGCQSTICSCSVHKTMNVSISITQLVFTFEPYCGTEERWNQLKDAFEGNYALNWIYNPTSGACGGTWIYSDSRLSLSAISVGSAGGFGFYMLGRCLFDEWRCGLDISPVQIQQPSGWPCVSTPTSSGSVAVSFQSSNGLFEIARGTASLS